MKVFRFKYLVKCDMPACSNIAVNKFKLKDGDNDGLQLCDQCVKGMYSIISKKTNIKGEK